MSSYLGDYPRQEIDPCVIEIQILFSHFCSRCHICEEDLNLSDVDGKLEFWRERAQQIPPAVPFSAKSCARGHLTCVGCGNPPKLSEKNFFTSVGVVNHCCQLGKLFGIWSLIARVDNAETLQTPSCQTDQKKKIKHQLKTAPGVGYASAAFSHSNYFSLDTEHMKSQFASLIGQNQNTYDIIKERELAKDYLMVETLKLLGTFIYPDNSPTYNEFIKYLKVFFRASTLFDRIIDSLHNDSVDDLTRRASMILEICKFIMTVYRVPALVGLLLDPWPRKKTPGIVKICQNSNNLGTEYKILDPCSASLLQATKNIYQQSKTYLKLTQNGSSSGSLQSINICRAIIHVYELLYWAKQKRDSAPLHKPPEIQLDQWKVFAENNRVTFTDEVLKYHRFADEFTSVVNSNIKSRLNTISKEVATLTTSLPVGIFLKVAESRIDVMKVLIIGSEGSPYAGGLFIFDLFLPANYPYEPPKINFVLNGNDYDRFSFNPNLHVGGNVCLSILNTWHGNPHELWQPNKSTVLSVLISIQAMILGAPLPWLNEPGKETHSTTQAAVDHKNFIEAKTINYAMVEWIQRIWNPNTKEYIWKDISEMYWTLRGQQVFNYVKGWATNNPSLLNYGPPMRKPAIKKVKGLNPKGSSTAEQTEAHGENLVQKLANALGIESMTGKYIVKAYVPPPPQVPQIDGKRNFATYFEGPIGLEPQSSSNFNGPGKPYFMSQISSSGPESIVNVLDQSPQKWVYNGGRSQKDVRTACKEFGISYASTIKDSIMKLEAHVNGKGKMSLELTKKYGV